MGDRCSLLVAYHLLLFYSGVSSVRPGFLLWRVPYLQLDYPYQIAVASPAVKTSRSNLVYRLSHCSASLNPAVTRSAFTRPNLRTTQPARICIRNLLFVSIVRCTSRGVSVIIYVYDSSSLFRSHREVSLHQPYGTRCNLGIGGRQLAQTPD